MAGKKGAKSGPQAPHKYTPDVVDDLTQKLDAYIARVTVPFLKEFCMENGLYEEAIRRFICPNSERFTYLCDQLKYKQEVSLIRLTLANKANPAMAIFCLKNLARWTDRPPEESSEELINSQLDFANASKVDANRVSKYYE